MAPNSRGAHEEESIHGRADGDGTARADRTTVAEAAKKHKVSEPTIYAWRKHFGQMEAADVRKPPRVRIVVYRDFPRSQARMATGGIHAGSC